MSLKNMTLTTTAALGAGGGDPIVFTDDGITIPNGVHLVVPGDVNYLERRTVTAKVRLPVIDAKTGAYGKDKKTVSFTIPRLVDGKMIFNVIRIEREVHPTLDGDNVALLNAAAAQILLSADTVNFWAAGSVS